jgi:4-hydroxymandelate oxidase
VLPEIVEAVARRGVILLDGGIRRGTDVVKAMALGADAVQLGRPVLWGLALAGTDGVRRVLSMLRAEVDDALALCGARRWSELPPGLVRPRPPAA